MAGKLSSGYINPNAAPIDAFTEALRGGAYSHFLDIMGQPKQTTYQVAQKLAEQQPLDFMTIWGAYAGSNLLLKTNIVQDVANFATVHFVICPVRETDNLSERVVRTYRFPTALLDPSAPLAMQRHLTWSQESRSYTLQGYGLGMEFEKKSLDTPQMPMIFDGLLTAIKSATARTSQLSVLAALLDCHSVFLQMAGIETPQFNTLSDLMAPFFHTFAAIQKDYRGAATVTEYIKSSRQKLLARPATIVLAPPGTMSQLMLGSTYPTITMLSGEGAYGRLQAGTQAFRGLGDELPDVQEQERYAIDYTGNAGPFSPLEQLATFAGLFLSDNGYLTTFNECDVCHNTAAMRSPSIFAIGARCNFVRLSIESIINSDQHLDPNTGHLRVDLLQHLAANYRQILRSLDVEARKTVNGDDAIDAHIAMDDQGRPFVIKYFGEMDPYFFGDDVLAKSAAVNHATVRRQIGAEKMASLEAMISVLQDAANVPISQDKTQASPGEAFAAAVAAYYRNAPTNESTRLSRGNAYGADFLPPLFFANGRAYIGTRLSAGGAPVPMFFVTSRSVDASEFDTFSFYSAGGYGGAGPADASAADGEFVQELVPAPDFPPFFSSGGHAATIASALSGGDADAATWFTGPARTEARRQFEVVRNGWDVYDRNYFPLLQSVFSPNGTQDRSAQNLLMMPESCPFYVKPSGSPSPTLLSKLAFFQQAITGFRSPLAVGNRGAGEGTYGVGTGYAFAFARTGARDGIGGADNGPGGAFDAQVDGVGNVGNRNARRGEASTNRLPFSLDRPRTRLLAAHNPNGHDAAGTLLANPTLNLYPAINLLMQQPTLSTELAADFENNSGNTFADLLRQAMNNSRTTSSFSIVEGAGGANIPVAELDPVERFFGARLTQLRNRSLMNLLSDAGNREDVATATSFVNRIWSLLNVGASPRWTEQSIAAAASNAFADSQRSITNEMLSATTDPRRPGARREEQLAQQQQQYSRDVGELRADRYLSSNYGITRLQASGSIFQDVSDARAYTSILRPVSVQNTSMRVIAPFENVAEPLQLFAGTNITNLDRAALIATVGEVSGSSINPPPDIDSVRSAAKNVRAKARQEMTDIDVREGDHGLGPISMYTHGAAITGVTEESMPAAPAAPVRTTGAAGARGGVRDTRQRGGAGYGFDNGYGGSQTRYSSSSYSYEDRMGGVSDPYHPQADIYLYEPLLHESTYSRWMMGRVEHIATRIPNHLHRVMALAMITSVICRQVLIQMVRANFVLLRSYVLLQPFIDLLLGMLVAATPNIGSLEFAMPDVTLGLDSHTLMMNVRFSVEMGAYITQSQEVTLLPAFKISGYLGGGTPSLVRCGATYSEAAPDSGDDYDFDSRHPDQRKADIFVFSSGVHYDVPEQAALTGRFNASAFSARPTPNAARELRLLSYPCALFADLSCGFHRLQRQLLGERPRDDGWNDVLSLSTESSTSVVCYRLPQRRFNPVTGVHDILEHGGCGPLGNMTPGTSCAAVFDGQPGMLCESYQIAASATALATTPVY